MTMVIKDFVSELTQKKLQGLENLNRNQFIEIEKLKRNNSILHLRLAEALRPQNVLNIECEECLANKEKDVKFKKFLIHKLRFLTDMIKIFKDELQTLSADVSKMTKKVNESCQSFKWILSEKLQDIQDYAVDANALSFKIEQLEESLQLSQELYQKEKERRKELHNALVQVRGNIRVHCRIRPVLMFDQDSGLTDYRSDDENTDCIRQPPKPVVHSLSDEVLSVSPSPGKPHRLFEFERVFTSQENQQVVFDEVKPLLTSFLDGYNVCVMAYGQTGSGKSYTMLGEEDKPGIVPRAADQLFRLVEDRNLQDSVQFAVSVAEVYNNDIFDLLSDERRREKHGIVTSEEGSKDVPTLSNLKVETAKDIQSLLECGLERRAKMSTRVHDHSSRSHLIVSVTATFFHGNDDCRSDCETPRKRPQSAFDCNDFDSSTVLKRTTRRQLPQLQLGELSQTLSSPKQRRSYSVPSSPICSSSTVSSFKTKLQFVDLAGSECVGMSGVTGTALRESSYINRSLSALADVLGALSEHRSHIPYRNSKLTHLLQDSIGGDAKMLVLLCVSPTRRYLTETLQCLGFGSRARQVQRGPIKKRVVPSSNSRSESPNKSNSPRQGRPVSSVVRRVLN